MGTRYYPARIAADDGSFLFQAIDIPAAISAGDTVEDALAHGVEALQLVIETWDEKADGPLPEPSTIAAATAKLDAEQSEDLVTIQLAQVVMPENAVKITMTIPADLLKRVDASAGSYGRSGWICDAAREKLAGAYDLLPVAKLRDPSHLAGKNFSLQESAINPARTRAKAGRHSVPGRK